MVKTCNCTGTNQIFVEETVSCYTCPQGSTALLGALCVCQGANQELSVQGGVEACVCRWGFVMNAANTCVKQTPTTTAAAP
jgi:hypothetical protein